MGLYLYYAVLKVIKEVGLLCALAAPFVLVGVCSRDTGSSNL